MAEMQDQSNEVIAKEITIAVIQNSGLNGDYLLEFACKSYDMIYKQVIKTYGDTK